MLYFVGAEEQIITETVEVNVKYILCACWSSFIYAKQFIYTIVLSTNKVNHLWDPHLALDHFFKFRKGKGKGEGL